MRSIRTILVVRLLAGGILLFGVAGMVFQWSVKRALRAELDDALRVSGRSLQAFVEQREGRIRMESDVDDILDYRSGGGASVFVLRDQDGRELKRSLSLHDENVPSVKPDENKPAFFNFDLADGRRLRCLAVVFEPEVERPLYPDEKSRSMVLINGRDRGPLEATLDRFQKILLVSGASALAGLATLLWWGVRQGLRPLDQLVADISSVDASTLTVRFPGQSLPAELQPITARLNELLERLEVVFQREKRFTGDVSHELRTPLAELRTLAEVNLMVAPASPEENAVCWEEVKAVAARMESLVLRLLELARAEQGAWLVKPELVRPSDEVQAIWRRHGAVADGRGITLKEDVSGNLEFATDPVLFELVLTNLIGNAVHHARAGSVFQIRSEGRALHLINEVDDLLAEDLPLLFERFWKKDSARTDGRRHGLGLSLARDIAALLGGSLAVRMPSADQVEFILSLPDTDGDGS